MNQLTASIDVTVRSGPGSEHAWSAPAGSSLAWLVDNAPGLSVRDPRYVAVTVGGMPVAADDWPTCRPRRAVRIVAVAGDSDAVGSGLQLLQTGLGSGGIRSPLFAFSLLTGFARSTLDGFVPSGKADFSSGAAGTATPELKNAGTSLNPIEPGAVLNRLLGTDKVAPQVLANPYFDLDGTDELLHMIVGLGGETDWGTTSDRFVNGTAVADLGAAVEEQTRNGVSGDTANTLVTKSVLPQLVGQEMPNYRYLSNKPAADKYIANNGDSSATVIAARSKEFLATTALEWDEFWAMFAFPQGLAKLSGGAYVATSTALRVRLRLRGGAWRNGPELRFRGANVIPFKYQVKFIRSASEPSSPPAAGKRVYKAMRLVDEVAPGISAPGNGTYTADSYFGTTGRDASHVHVFEDRVEIYLDPASWAAGQYEIGFLRGTGMDGENLENLARHFDIQGLDGGGWFMTQAQTGRSQAMVLDKLQSVLDQHPIVETEIAQWALKIRNMQVVGLEAIATGKCPIFSGGNWSTVAKTSNPASWARHGMLADVQAKKLPGSLVNDTEMEAFYDFCTGEGLEINMLLTDETVDDLLDLCALAGEAKKKRGATWGFWLDEDLSAQTPAIVLMPLNSWGFEEARTFEDVPKAFRVEWRDSANGYANEETTVYFDGYSEDGAGGTIAVSDDEVHGLIDPFASTAAQINRRALRLLREANLRARAATIDCGIVSQQLERGDLIGLNHDVINRNHSSAHVEAVITSDGKVTGLRLDRELLLGDPAVSETIDGPSWWGAPSMWAEPSFWRSGTFGTNTVDSNWWAQSSMWTAPSFWTQITAPLALAVAIQLMDGTAIVKTINEVTGSEVISFATPFDTLSMLKEGCRVAAGPASQEFERFIIQNMRGAPDDGARLVLMPEAPGLHL